MIDAYDAGGRNLAARFGLNISEASAQHNVRNWKKNLEERGHLENFVRGVAPGSKFCFDGEELEVIKRAKQLNPRHVPRRVGTMGEVQGIPVRLEFVFRPRARLHPQMLTVSTPSPRLAQKWRCTRCLTASRSSISSGKSSKRKTTPRTESRRGGTPHLEPPRGFAGWIVISHFIRELSRQING